ncbi:hypothetical protein D3C81_2008980 [compost metagenome]
MELFLPECLVFLDINRSGSAPNRRMGRAAFRERSDTHAVTNDGYRRLHPSYGRSLQRLSDHTWVEACSWVFTQLLKACTAGRSAFCGSATR